MRRSIQHVAPRCERRVLRSATANSLTTLRAALLVLLVATLGPLHDAYAQGFGIYEQGTCAMGRAGASVAFPCNDGSAIFLSPAQVIRPGRFIASVGGTLISAQGEFTADETGETTDLDNDPILVPHAYLQYGINERLTAGAGLYVPYGLATEWPLDFDGRFLGYDNQLQSIYIQPTLAYQITDRISIGGGLAIVIGNVELNRRLDLSQQPVPAAGLPPGTTFGDLGIPFHTDFADVNLDADGATGFGGNFGVQVQATDRILLGARFMTPIELEYDGTAQFEQIQTGATLPLPPAGIDVDDLLAPLFATGPLVEQDVETSITMPAQLVLGVSVQATQQLKLLADYQWTGWSSFDEVDLDFEAEGLDETLVENYDNTNGIRVGAQYALNETWTFRLGYLTHGAAAPDETVTPLLPEAYRNEFTAGVGWQLTPTLALDVAYQYLRQQDRRGRVRDIVPGVENPTAEQLNTGEYSFNAHLFGATLSLNLGGSSAERAQQ